MRTTHLAVLALLCSAQVRAEETAAFLKIGVGARALAMGGAYTALADESSALFWNQAGLSRVAKRELGISHAELPVQTRYDFLGFVQPTRFGTWGVGGVYLNQGTIEGRDASGKPAAGFGASDAAMQVALARKLEGGPRLGAGLKYLRSSIADSSAQTFAVDLAGQHDLKMRGPGIPVLGLAVQNLGPGMRFLDQTNSLPLTLAVGVGYRLPAGLTLALDFKQRPNLGNSEVCVGTEYAVMQAFALRAGYGSAKAGSGGLSEAAGFAAGFGIRVYGYMLDYSMTPFAELGNVQHFSLGARF